MEDIKKLKRYKRSYLIQKLFDGEDTPANQRKINRYMNCENVPPPHIRKKISSFLNAETKLKTIEIDKECANCGAELNFDSVRLGDEMICENCITNKKDELIVNWISFIFSGYEIIFSPESPLYKILKDSVEAGDAEFINGSENILDSRYVYDTKLKAYVRKLN